MKINYVNAMLERDPMTHIPVCVLATEIPILQMVHGGKLRDIEMTETVADVNPDDEFERLANAYRDRQGTGKSFAEEVFGSPRGIVMQMESLSGESTEKASKPARGRGRPAASEAESE